jgi:hypothetical protein
VARGWQVSEGQRTKFDNQLGTNDATVDRFLSVALEQHYRAAPAILIDENLCRLLSENDQQSDLQ